MGGAAARQGGPPQEKTARLERRLLRVLLRRGSANQRFSAHVLDSDFCAAEWWQNSGETRQRLASATRRHTKHCSPSSRAAVNLRNASAPCSETHQVLSA